MKFRLNYRQLLLYIRVVTQTNDENALLVGHDAKQGYNSGKTLQSTDGKKGYARNTTGPRGAHAQNQ